VVAPPTILFRAGLRHGRDGWAIAQPRASEPLCDTAVFWTEQSATALYFPFPFAAMGKFATSVGHAKYKKRYSFRGLRPIIPHRGLCPGPPQGASPLDPRYRLALRARHGHRTLPGGSLGPMLPKAGSEFFFQKTKLSDLSYSIKIWTHHSIVLSQIARLTDGRTDRQTDRQTEFSSINRVCISWSAIKTDRS